MYKKIVLLILGITLLSSMGIWVYTYQKEIDKYLFPKEIITQVDAQVSYDSLGLTTNVDTFQIKNNNTYILDVTVALRDSTGYREEIRYYPKILRDATFQFDIKNNSYKDLEIEAIIFKCIKRDIMTRDTPCYGCPWLPKPKSPADLDLDKQFFEENAFWLSKREKVIEKYNDGDSIEFSVSDVVESGSLKNIVCKLYFHNWFLKAKYHHTNGYNYFEIFLKTKSKRFKIGSVEFTKKIGCCSSYGEKFIFIKKDTLHFIE